MFFSPTGWHMSAQGIALGVGEHERQPRRGDAILHVDVPPIQRLNFCVTPTQGVALG